MEFFWASWEILSELAPWLLLGMALSGLLHIALPSGLIRRRLRGPGGVVTAVAIGVPLPLCSCGVIPAGIGLKNDGASDGAAVGFLISTPQTGVDSILVSASFFGWPFALFKMVTALVTGLIGGWTVEWMSSAKEPEPSRLDSEGRGVRRDWRDFFSHSLMILRSIWGWLLAGILISAAITQWVPREWLAGVSAAGTLPAMLLSLAVAAPLYVCATASVPIAAALVDAGLPPAAALVFLLAGPATNVTTIAAVNGRFGWRVAGIYLGIILLGSMLGGWIFEQWFRLSSPESTVHLHEHLGLENTVSAVLLLGLLAWFAYDDARRWLTHRRRKNSGGLEASALELAIDGMHCSGCAESLERELRKTGQVSDVAISVTDGRAVIGGTISRAAASEVVRNCGFQVRE